ncbi:MAG: MarR family transcriptional regulator [Pseudomonadota bacterium]
MPVSTRPSPTPAAMPDNAAAASRVLRQFRVVFNAVKTHFRQVEKVAGIGGAQVWALSVIHERPGIGVSELARAMDVHQSTASNLIKPLLERGLARTVKDAQDRRAVGLHLCDSGRHLLNQAPAPFAGVLPDALAGLDAATLARLERDLGTLISALEAGDAGAGTPLADL